MSDVIGVEAMDSVWDGICFLHAVPSSFFFLHRPLLLTSTLLPD